MDFSQNETQKMIAQSIRDFAEKEIRRTCNQVETINSAKINTEKVLSQTFTALGWKAKFIWQ